MNNKHELCIVGYHSKFQVIKYIKGLRVDSLIKTCKIIFAEYQSPSRLMSDAGTNLVSVKFQDFYRCLDIHHAVSSLHDHQSMGKVEACIMFVK